MKITDQKGGKGLVERKMYQNSHIKKPKWPFIPYFSVQSGILEQILSAS